MIAWSERPLHRMTPPLIIQEYLNHNGVIFKVFVIGEWIQSPFFGHLKLRVPVPAWVAILVRVPVCRSVLEQTARNRDRNYACVCVCLKMIRAVVRRPSLRNLPLTPPSEDFALEFNSQHPLPPELDPAKGICECVFA
jgi:hypothetical protein